jgi:ABC-type Fe3+-hydroxamate transport system substrate-binding protein
MARVVSLLPSATEIVCLVAAECDADGTAPALVAKSHECDWPPGLDVPMLTAAKTTFTTSADVDQQVRSALASGNGLYTVDQEHLKQLQPDVIVTQVKTASRLGSGLPSNRGTQLLRTLASPAAAGWLDDVVIHSECTWHLAGVMLFAIRRA